MIVFALVYSGATIVLLPGSALTLAAGFIWGPIVGMAVVFPSAVIAALAAFVIGRTLARKWVEEAMATRPRFRAFDRAIGARGLRFVTLLRLSPVMPFNVLNYALAITNISAREYLVGTIAGMLPGAFMYVYLGSSISSIVQLGASNSKATSLGERIFFVVGLIATVIVTLWITRLARRALSGDSFVDE